MSVKDGSCFDPTTTTPETTTTTGALDVKVDCNFEEDTCNWKNINEDEASMKWVLDTGHTADHTSGTINGGFIYADFNNSVQASANLELSQPIFVTDKETHCLQFYYKSDSAVWTTLELYMRTEEEYQEGKFGQPHWKSSSAMGNDWFLGQYEVSGETEDVSSPRKSLQHDYP